MSSGILLTSLNKSESDSKMTITMQDKKKTAKNRVGTTSLKAIRLLGQVGDPDDDDNDDDAAAIDEGS